MTFYNIRDPVVFHLDIPLCVAFISWSKVEASVSSLRMVEWTNKKGKRGTDTLSGGAMFFELWVMTH